ncbi:MAG TPA: transporter associated domain-containing protein [Treponemataceae bacterium]|nr:transporter associated domain-containing protein [Treponemataceae bacterium]
MSDNRTEEEKGFYVPATRKLGSCMTHRPEIIWIESGMEKESILTLIREYPGFSFFPVCSGTVDSVVGVLSVRDFFDSLLRPQWPGLRSLIRKPLYVSETVTILNALKMLEETKNKVAFTIDEYGGIEGLITRNGLLGELIKEFSGEIDEDDPEIVQRADGSFLIGGHVRMEELEEFLDLPPTYGDNQDYYTLAGYLLALNDSIPKTGDILNNGPYQFEIVDMDGHRIDKVLISSEILPQKLS